MLEIFLVNCIIFIRKDIIKKQNGLNIKDTKKFNYTKLRLANDYEYESEKEEQTKKQPDKTESPKKPTRTDAKEFSEIIARKKTVMNRELFKKYFSFQMPTAMLRAVYNTNSKKKNS